MQAYRYHIILLLLIICVGVLLYINPIPQDLEYHNFADQRSFFGIPNFWNVMSNLPMFFLGAYGTWLSVRHWSQRPDWASRWIPVILCVGIFLACFGSAYYHWAPDNNTLVWDQLPMTFMFMPIFALIIYDFIGKKEGQIAFLVLLPLGMLSVFYWQYTESIGAGDLRLYAFVQFFPMLIAPFILWLFPRKTSYVKYVVYVIILYSLAKVVEHFDDAIFEIIGFWSGHTIKHLFGAVSLFFVLKLIVAWEKELV